MENKINVAELLQDCPRGMELDCTMYDNAKFDYIASGSMIYPIKIQTPDGQIGLNKYGCYSNNKESKCVIFPKGKTTWEGFHRPFKDGDILANVFGGIVIYKGKMKYDKNLVDYYCGYRPSDNAFIIKENKDSYFGHINDSYYATEEEKQKLFNAINENGYKWNTETKTLEKLIELKFKVGDRIRLKENRNYIYTITSISEKENKYECGVTFVLRFSEQDNWELVPDKFDINILDPFNSRVLVRDEGDSLWQPSMWGIYDEGHSYPYITIGNRYRQCIPYEGNEHLIGTTDNCDEFYKTWE